MKSVIAVFTLTLVCCVTHKLYVYFDNIERYIGIYLQNPSKYNESTLRTAIDSYSRRFAKFYLKFKNGEKSAFKTAAVMCNREPPEWLQMYPNNITVIQKRFNISEVDLDCMSISLYELQQVWVQFLTGCKTKIEYLKFVSKYFN